MPSVDRGAAHKNKTDLFYFSQFLKDVPLFLFGALFIILGMAMYFFGELVSIIRLMLRLGEPFRSWNEAIVWYSGMPFTLGLILAAADLVLLLPGKRRRSLSHILEPVLDRHCVVALTAYNDEASIADAVADFRGHPLVKKIIVVENNSSDKTAEIARAAGAVVVTETYPGYGRCVYRCFQEALAEQTEELIVLCEGDMTFRAKDVEKLVAYIDHAGVVNGTRIVEQLREYSTQLSTFIYYGNFFVGKLLEFKHLGRGTFTDVGTTYKLVRRSCLQRLMPRLNPAINLEFNAHFLDTALASGERVVECPITFHPRVGISKGGNASNLRALRVGIRMIVGLCYGWSRCTGARTDVETDSASVGS
jgi:cellulose synthase/poly-beta-1,6-N-acetylglucosamine synthase-like glycosyltransferase